MLQLPKIGGYSFRITSGDKDLASVLFRLAPLSELPPGMVAMVPQPPQQT